MHARRVGVIRAPSMTEIVVKHGGVRGRHPVDDYADAANGFRKLCATMKCCHQPGRGQFHVMLATAQSSMTEPSHDFERRKPGTAIIESGCQGCPRAVTGDRSTRILRW